MFVMRANPGGQLQPDQILGRDQVVEECWRELKDRSLLITAERRSGKTQLLRLLAARLPADTHTTYLDLEGTRTRGGFADAVLESLGPIIPDRRLGHRALGALRRVRHKSVPTIDSARWSNSLERTFESLIRERPAWRFVLLWDEIPLLLHQISREEGPAAACEVLDRLRAIRHDDRFRDQIRMVFTGSVGMHIIIDELRAAGYRNDPLNDLADLDLPPLSADDATDLAQRLLAGSGLTSLSPHLPGAIAALSDGVPHYVHGLVREIEREVAPRDVNQLEPWLDDWLASAPNPWKLAYFEDRIHTYYPDPTRALAFEILDLIAVEPAQPTTELNRGVRHKVDADHEQVRKVLRSLVLDHYISGDPTNGYRFRRSLLRRYWRLSRALGS